MTEVKAPKEVEEIFPSYHEFITLKEGDGTCSKDNHAERVVHHQFYTKKTSWDYNRLSIEQPYMNEEESASYDCEFDGGFIDVHLNFETNQALIDGWRSLFCDELTVEEAEQVGTELGKTIKETIKMLK